jgi:hypothetical protein
VNAKFLRPLVALGAAALAPIPAESRTDDFLVRYRCGDLVVVGRVESLGYEPVELANDLLGHGWIAARVTVRKVLAGRADGPVVPIRYFAHAYFRDDRDFMLVIDRRGPGGDLIRSALLMEGGRRPHLARSCDRKAERVESGQAPG